MNKSILEVIKWDEPLLNGFSESNALNIANIEYKVTGYLNGKITSTYIIHYTKYDTSNIANAESTFVGFSHFKGILNNEEVSITFSENGSHSQGKLVSHLVSKSDNKVANYTFTNNQVELISEF